MSHLTACGCCGTYLETYLVTVELARLAYSDGDASVPREAPEKLVRGLAARRPGA